MSKLTDLTGRRVGRVTVVRRADDKVRADGRRRPQWICRCDCGTEWVVLAQSLSPGRTRSCGCLQREEASQRSLKDLTGQVFGDLTVLRRAPNQVGPSGRRNPAWLCLCACGEESVAQGGQLRNGRVKSCGHRRAFVAYGGAHRRVYRDRGPAAGHQCTDCGAQASQWAYDHDDPDELYEEIKRPDGKKITVPYSLDPARYSPRCTSCHVKFDANHCSVITPGTAS